MSDAEVDHSREVAGAVKARWRRSVPAERAVECHGNLRDERQRSSNRVSWLGWPFEAFEQRQASVPTWYIC
jgi:hypothetical protein